MHYPEQIFILFQRPAGRVKYEGINIRPAVCKYVAKSYKNFIINENEAGGETICAAGLPVNN
jgi:hypothetical protein